MRGEPAAEEAACERGRSALFGDGRLVMTAWRSPWANPKLGFALPPTDYPNADAGATGGPSACPGARAGLRCLLLPPQTQEASTAIVQLAARIGALAIPAPRRGSRQGPCARIPSAFHGLSADLRCIRP